jgi:hypothetical protein
MKVYLQVTWRSAKALYTVQRTGGAGRFSSAVVALALVLFIH